jgi:hypothetical protein
MEQHPQYSHFYISESGEVFSTKSNKVLKTFKHKHGYLVFSTRLNGRNSKSILLKVHRLVAETYIPNPENKPYINHKDGVKANNHISNLEWVTASENVKHAYATGLAKGKPKYDNPQCKVSPETVAEVKRLREEGKSFRAIANIFGVSHSRIQDWVKW